MQISNSEYLSTCNGDIFYFLIRLFNKAVKKQYPSPFGSCSDMANFIDNYYGYYIHNCGFDLNTTIFYANEYLGTEYWIGVSDIDKNYCRGQFKNIIVFDHSPNKKCVIVPSIIDKINVQNISTDDVLRISFIMCEYMVAMLKDTHDSYAEIKFASLYSIIWYLFDEYRIKLIDNSDSDKTTLETIIYNTNRDLFSTSDLNTVYEFIKKDMKYCNLFGCSFPNYYKLAGIGERFRLFIWEKNHGSN